MELNRQLLVINEGECQESPQFTRQLQALGFHVDSVTLQQFFQPAFFQGQSFRVQSIPGIHASSACARPKIFHVGQSVSRSDVDRIVTYANACDSIANLLLISSNTLEAWPTLHDAAVEICLLPCPAEEVTLRLQRSMEVLGQNAKRRESREYLLQQNLIGTADNFLQAMELMHRYIDIDAPVMITGETGTGKELAARALHYSSHRQSMPFQALNCGALPDYLIENELFGHAKGAYTDAKIQQDGLIGLAEGGTLFLDEVDSLSHKAQTTLLRFLQDGKYRPVGGSAQVSSNVRIISATNNDLDALADRQEFRKDLVFRLNTLPLTMPALRQRRDDILVLAEHFLRECEIEHEKGKKLFHPSTKNKMLDYSWPGNVRELGNYVQRAYLLSDQAMIMMGPSDNASIFNTSVFNRYELNTNQISEPVSVDYSNTLSDVAVLNTKVQPPPNFSDAKKAIVDNFEVSYINHLLNHTRGNVSRAARLAGKERRVFGRLMKKHRIDKSAFVLG